LEKSRNIWEILEKNGLSRLRVFFPEFGSKSEALWGVDFQGVGEYKG
jgi:hypothetical protein